jgi:flotillin
MGTGEYLIIMVIAAVLLAIGFLIFLAKRYKRCPSNRILVVYGRTKANRASRCVHGGGTFIIPLIQNFAYLSLDPLQIEIPLSGALSAENIRINVPSVFTVAVGTSEETMNAAAERLLGLTTTEIAQQARDIIFGQLRQVIASMRIQDINRDRDQFLQSIQSSMEPELAKIGLVLINVNITDITDESGYIEAIGRKAASEAIQQAEIDVAEQRRHGAIGVAEAHREQEIQVATAMKDQAVQVAALQKERTVGEQRAAFERQAQVKDAERQMRIQVAAADAKAVAGENTSKADIADTNAKLRVKEAEAYQFGETRHREAQAAVLEAQYKAETQAATANASKIEAEQRAALEAPALAEKAKITVDAHAEAERQAIEAEGEAKAIFLRLEAEARGQFEILKSKADGLRELVSSCGTPESTFQMLMLEHIDKLAETAAQAISNVKFDKVVVWDGGNGSGSGAADFVKRLGGMLPPMLQVMKDIGGVEMPEFLGRIVSPEQNGAPADTPAKAEPLTSGSDGSGKEVTRGTGKPERV